MKKVLIINTIGLGYEGITSVINNYVSAMKREDLELHFIASAKTSENLKIQFGAYGFVHTLESRKKSLKQYLTGLAAILKTGFDAVHIHGNSGTMLIEVLLAKAYGVKNVMIHAHSTKTDHPAVNAVLKRPMMALADVCIACSRSSGEWLYGKHQHIVLNNAIDLQRFRFDPEARKLYRAEFGVKDEYLVGHIGHFSEPKNHFYLIDIFYEFHKLKPDAKLLLVSDGPRFEQVKEKVKQLSLQDAVIFAGRRADADKLYQAMDVFILPSCWEGLPLVLLEAQASGLPVLASDRITRDVQCTARLQFLSIDGPAAVWAQRLAELSGRAADRTEDTAQQLREHGFDIRAEAEKLRRLYLGGT